MLIALVLGEQRQEDWCRFKASLVYTGSSRFYPKNLSRNNNKSREQSNESIPDWSRIVWLIMCPWMDYCFLRYTSSKPSRMEENGGILGKRPWRVDQRTEDELQLRPLFINSSRGVPEFQSWPTNSHSRCCQVWGILPFSSLILIPPSLTVKIIRIFHCKPWDSIS